MEQSKKIILVAIIIGVILLSTGSYLAYKYLTEERQLEKEYSTLKHFVVNDKISGNLTDGHFYYYKSLNSSQEIFIKQGDFIEGLNEANLTVSNKVTDLTIYTFKEGYYVGIKNTPIEKDNIEVTTYKYPDEITDIKVSTIDLKKNEEQTINLTISTDYKIQNPKICFTWSLGIINIKGEEAEIPNFLSKKVDKCFRIKTIMKEEQSFYFTIETGILNADDYLDIYVVDECKVSNDDFKNYYDEQGEEDICMKTYKYKIY